MIRRLRSAPIDRKSPTLIPHGSWSTWMVKSPAEASIDSVDGPHGAVGGGGGGGGGGRATGGGETVASQPLDLGGPTFVVYSPA